MKTIEKYLTRDVPLVLIECWYEGRVKYFKEFFGIDFPKTVFLSSNGVFEFYINLTDFDFEFPQKLASWSRVEENREKLPLVSQFMKEGLDYFRHLKIKRATSVKLMDYLKEVRKFLARGFPGVLVTHHFPRWQGQFQKEGKKLFEDMLIEEIIKWLRKEGNIFMDEGANTVYTLLKVIAKKQKWDSDLLKYITLQELSKAIRFGSLPVHELRRRQHNRFVFWGSEVIYEPEFDEKLKTDQLKFKDFDNLVESKNIKGTIANRGYAKGFVRIIFNREQLPLVKTGEVLVAPMTAPWYMPVLKKISAIVTDEGGLASHAAIISREFNKPCIIDTKIVTKVLKDGDMVEVDANKGVVKIIKKA